MTVNRYRARYQRWNNELRANESGSGEVVLASDYDALAAKLAELKAARELSALASATMRDESIAKSDRIAQLEAALLEAVDLRESDIDGEDECTRRWVDLLSRDHSQTPVAHSKSQQKRFDSLARAGAPRDPILGDYDVFGVRGLDAETDLRVSPEEEAANIAREEAAIARGRAARETLPEPKTTAEPK